MGTAITIVFVGAIIFMSHFFAALFQRTKIPDVLWLFGLGLLIGPILHLASPASFGKVGPIFTTITLIFILFESGIDQRIEPLVASLRGTAKITTYNFLMTLAVGTSVCYFFTDLGFLRSMMLSSIVGGTSSAVATTLSKAFPMSEKTRTILILESAVSDVFTLAVPLTLMTAYKVGNFDIAFMTGQMIAAFVVATMLGIAAAFAWSVLLNRIRILKNTVFTTPAFVFILFGIVEMLNFSGPIAALAFGITLGNIDVLGPPLLKNVISRKPISLEENEKAFFAEAVFLLRTFFFVYIGLSVRLADAHYFLVGAAITCLLFWFRVPMVRLSVAKNSSLKDATYMAAMNPKGLGAAVLASVPAQQGIPGGEAIQSIVFAVILCSTMLTTCLYFLIDKTAVSKIYAFLFRWFFGMREPIEGQKQASSAAKISLSETSQPT